MVARWTDTSKRGTTEKGKTGCVQYRMSRLLESDQFDSPIYRLSKGNERKAQDLRQSSKAAHERHLQWKETSNRGMSMWPVTSSTQGLGTRLVGIWPHVFVGLEKMANSDACMNYVSSISRRKTMQSRHWQAKVAGSCISSLGEEARVWGLVTLSSRVETILQATCVGLSTEVCMR